MLKLRKVKTQQKKEKEKEMEKEKEKKESEKEKEQEKKVSVCPPKPLRTTKLGASGDGLPFFLSLPQFLSFPPFLSSTLPHSSLHPLSSSVLLLLSSLSQLFGRLLHIHRRRTAPIRDHGVQ